MWTLGIKRKRGDQKVGKSKRDGAETPTPSNLRGGGENTKSDRGRARRHGKKMKVGYQGGRKPGRKYRTCHFNLEQEKNFQLPPFGTQHSAGGEKEPHTGRKKHKVTTSPDRKAPVGTGKRSNGFPEKEALGEREKEGKKKIKEKIEKQEKRRGATKPHPKKVTGTYRGGGFTYLVATCGKVGQGKVLKGSPTWFG